MSRVARAATVGGPVGMSDRRSSGRVLRCDAAHRTSLGRGSNAVVRVPERHRRHRAGATRARL